MIDLIADVENWDAVLGFQILKHKPEAYERPDWTRILPSLRSLYQVQVAGTAILREGNTPAAEVGKRKFARMLDAAGWKVVWVEYEARRLGMTVGRDVTDDVTAYHLARSRGGIVIAGTHEQYAAGALAEQKARGAQVGVVGFADWISDRSADVIDFIQDLEYDLGVFDRPLPRVRPF